METISSNVVEAPNEAFLEVEFKTTDRVNFASAQNGVSILKKLVLRNNGQSPLENLTVLIECQPALIKPKSWAIDRIAPGGEATLSHLDTPLNSMALAGLNEAEFGELTLVVKCANEVVLEEQRRIEMLARDEWGGIGEMAHLLAAFVSPNDAVVASILKDASRLLETGGQSGSLEGYQSKDAGRTWMLAGAIWSALTGLGLSYAVPPTSFELRGQKVRDPGRIRAEGLATCLDSSLLIAAGFEAVGLNPVVLFSEGHAWTGVWLTDRDFGSVVEPDVITVRKAVDAREFVMLETTLLTKRPTIGFEEACSAGRDHVAEQNEHLFQMAVDIQRARAARIRPLASHRVESETTNANDIPASPAALPKPLGLGLLPADLTEEEPKSANDRISRWQRKLLDLSLRNRLLNFRDTKQTLPFICSDISSLEDQLAGGKRFKTLALKDEDPLGHRDLLLKEEPALFVEVARDAFTKGQIAVPLTGKEMNVRLLELYRRAKSDMQEGGANTLFLAAGFLRWKKTEGDPRSYRAPLLLIPVKISRRSAQSDFVIEHHEDDVRFNATLLEFLKHDFDLTVPELEGELPHDNSGYDLPLIFEIMRRKVRDIAGFEVVEDLALSTFSFAKFLMWKDLVDRTDNLRESRLVKHLVDNPAEPFLAQDAPGLPQAVDVDRRIAPKDLFTPLPADSSQLAAVLAAQEGHDFVLIGPPGTGKSQTIANIISQCLAIGKTVLFVAEKSVALDVVYRRLASHGLGDAVLELHSNKADRKSVLNQLDRSWERAVKVNANDWIQVTDELALTRKELNAYVEALHRKGTQGFSVYQGIGRIASSHPEFNLSFDNINAHDAESYAHLLRVSETLGRCREIVQDHPSLDLVASGEWSFGWQAELLNRAATLRTLSLELSEISGALAQAVGFDADPDVTPDRREKLTILSGITLEGEDVSWALSKNLRALHQEAEELSSQLAAYRTVTSGLCAKYPMNRIKTIPLEKLDADWRLAQTKIWPLSIFSKSSVRKLLQTYATEGSTDPTRDITGLIEAQELRSTIDASPLRECPAFAGVDTDTVRLANWIESARTMCEALDKLKTHIGNQEAWSTTSVALAARKEDPLRELMNRFSRTHGTWNCAASAFAETAKTDPGLSTLLDLDECLSNIAANKEHLSNWTHWTAARSQAEAAGLGALVSALSNGAIKTSAKVAIETAYAAWWLPLAIDAEPCLRGFSDWHHEDTISQFRALDTRATEMAADQILDRIQHGLPARDSVPRRSGLGTLRHQLSLQRPSMPIRALISEMAENFTQLAPCVLMSPLSVAQYLPTGQAAFDVVIFDEASQITTWDAIGAIARGRQAIIVGDPKQLPPTNFFGRADDNEQELPESERDLLSILDEVAAAGIPTQQLDWHYRSRDEALIAFSNWHYYQGRLVTFPSPTTSSEAVQLHQIDGVYGRGQGRTNEAEAQAIVGMIVRRLKEWLNLPEEERLTLGVITFNMEQQGMILDLLDDARRSDPSLEWFFEDSREEPVIVKNLENIQGDERDIMLFSITFGPDHAGKLSMAFGALNSDGGEKRLNVAITRARRELHVFASIQADDIDLSRTKALGVKHLKNFLDFAARGSVALPAQNQGSLGPVENVFEAAVKAAIEAKGWELRPQIGVSGFRIDLGVVHPDHAGAYLAGLECDGATYHSCATARDRDKIRQAVLEGLGWKILRIWSTDWFKNPKAVVERLHKALIECLETDRAKRAQKRTQEEAARALATEQAGQHAATEHETESSLETRQDTQETEQQSELEEQLSKAHPLVDETPAVREPLVAQGGFQVETSAEPIRQETKHESLTITPNADKFFDASYNPTLERLIANIVREEGPMPLHLLGRRISALHGWQRTGRRIAERIHNSLKLVEAHSEEDVVFLWSTGTHSNRASFRFRNERGIRDISRTEIATLYDQHAAALNGNMDPIVELARLAGIGRLSSDAKSYLESCAAWRANTMAKTLPPSPEQK